MPAGRLWTLALAALALVVVLYYGSQANRELTELRSSIDSLQQEVASLGEASTQDESGQVADLSEAVNRMSLTADELRDSIESLGGSLDGQLARIEELEAQLDLLASALEKPSEDTFTLQLLHASDMDGSAGALGNVESFSAILDGFRRQLPHNTLVLSSGGNYIPGPRYYAANDESTAPVLGVPGNGRGDIALLNAMGFQASALGNHELDRGADAFAATIAMETEDGSTYPGAMFPYLSSNLVFTAEDHLADLVAPDAQEAFLSAGGLAGSAVITVGGERIGVVGATTPALRSITGSSGIEILPEEPDDIAALAAVIQSEVDSLVAWGINKVILLAHMNRIEIEKELAARLVDVDIIVGGGSSAILADSTDRLRTGDQAADSYPLRFESPNGEPALLVNTDADYRYLGRLVVEFDEQGVAISDSIDPYVSGAYTTDRQGGQAFPGRPIPEVTRIVESLRSVLHVRDSNIVGRTSVYLAGERQDVRTQETNLGNLTADANLWYARRFDPEVAVSLKNAGGIRSSIGIRVQPPGTINPADVEYSPPPANPVTGRKEGQISQFEVQNTASFNNGLVIIPVTAEELARLVEHGVGFEGVGEVTGGRFPQVGGMRFSFDPNAPAGRRVQSLAIVDDDGRVVDRIVENGALAGDPDRRIKVVTLNFLANGGDEYPYPIPSADRVDLAGEAGQPNAPDPDFPDTNGNGVLDDAVEIDPGLVDFAGVGAEQDALAEYLVHFYSETPFDVAETSPIEDLRIQNLSIPGKRDTVFEEVT